MLKVYIYRMKSILSQSLTFFFFSFGKNFMLKTLAYYIIRCSVQYMKMILSGHLVAIFLLVRNCSNLFRHDRYKRCFREAIMISIPADREIPYSSCISKRAVIGIHLVAQA